MREYTARPSSLGARLITRDNDIIEINLSRIIPAQKWRVIRLITKVWEFSAYIPSVKEATVIQKGRKMMKTRWRVEVDGIPISWVEEDFLTPGESAIYFKAVEGDLQEFSGEWLFKDSPGGTEVIINARLRVGIPVIKDFADAYVKKILTQNFEAILESAERRLISTKYNGYKSGDTSKIAGFGIIGHFYNYRHLEKCLKMLYPDFKMPSREFLGPLFHLTPSFKMQDILGFASKTGQTVNGCLIAATFIPEMIEQDTKTIFSKVVRACKVAEKHGVGIVTLGGFTSIVGERVGLDITNEVDVPVTTGNTFTAAMAIDGVLKAANMMNKDISSLKAAIVGGTGDIGSACARVLADKLRQITITGRTKANLSRVSKELAKKRKSRIIATTDNLSAVKDADIVIAAASASASILKIDWFKPGSIICDVGYPKNISYAPTSRKDIFIFSGGLSRSPAPLNFPLDIGLPVADVVYGCFAEAIILALEKRFEAFSFGRGNITPEKIEEIRQLGKKHGFEAADFYWGDEPIGSPLIENIKETVNV